MLQEVEVQFINRKWGLITQQERRLVSSWLTESISQVLVLF